MPTDFLTVKQAASLLGLHRDTLVRAADEGKIRSFRTPGGHRRFRREDVEAFLHGAAVPEAGEATA